MLDMHDIAKIVEAVTKAIAPEAERVAREEARDCVYRALHIDKPGLATQVHNEIHNYIQESVRAHVSIDVKVAKVVPLR